MTQLRLYLEHEMHTSWITKLLIPIASIFFASYFTYRATCAAKKQELKLLDAYKKRDDIYIPLSTDLVMLIEQHQKAINKKSYPFMDSSGSMLSDIPINFKQYLKKPFSYTLPSKLKEKIKDLMDDYAQYRKSLSKCNNYLIDKREAIEVKIKKNLSSLFDNSILNINFTKVSNDEFISLVMNNKDIILSFSYQFNNGKSIKTDDILKKYKLMNQSTKKLDIIRLNQKIKEGERKRKKEMPGSLQELYIIKALHEISNDFVKEIKKVVDENEVDNKFEEIINKEQCLEKMLDDRIEKLKNNDF